MVNIIKEEIEIEESLESRLRVICDFCNTTPTIINGSIRRIDKTNLTYIEPHRIYIKNNLYLAFNYSSDIYVNNLGKKIKLSELEDKVDKLQEIVDTFKQIWRKFLMYLQNKFFSNDKKTHEMIDELYYKDILDDKDIKIIHNDSYERYNNRDDDMEL